jgi:hypothetical protein
VAAVKVSAVGCPKRNPPASDNLARILIDQDKPAVFSILKHPAQEGVE